MRFAPKGAVAGVNGAWPLVEPPPSFRLGEQAADVVLEPPLVEQLEGEADALAAGLSISST